MNLLEWRLERENWSVNSHEYLIYYFKDFSRMCDFATYCSRVQLFPNDVLPLLKATERVSSWCDHRLVLEHTTDQSVDFCRTFVFSHVWGKIHVERGQFNGERNIIESITYIIINTTKMKLTDAFCRFLHLQQNVFIVVWSLSFPINFIHMAKIK